MRLLISLIMLFPLVVFSEPSEVHISPKRLANESFHQAVKRIKADLSQSTIKAIISRDTPLGNKVPVHEMDFSSVPVVVSYDELIHLFKVIRDSRFLHTTAYPDFERRISWLYPDDGCFARAALSGMKLESENLMRPAKIFAFGDLMVQTAYSEEGYVSWWYHVSTAVNYMGSIYVLDPALNADAPVLVEDWYNKMGNTFELSGTVCNAYAYDPFDSCYEATDSSEDRALKHQERYLDKEWERISSLGFDPVAFLGENPPWILDTTE